METPENTPRPLHLFEGYGVELEYMIADRQSLNIASLAAEVLAAVGGPWTREVERGPLAWSNELTLHVIELKTNGPAAGLDGLHRLFQQDIEAINKLLDPSAAVLLPTAMHPWLKPDEEAQLWQQEDAEIYTALDRIFGCTGHGWKNLQSAHLNLPFYDEAEFVQLHAAIRLILPLIPALAASSPFMDGGRGFGALDNRAVVYQNHCRSFPQAMGLVIPEPVGSIGQYHEVVLQPIYDALKPHDPEGVLAYDWINARGAITRFDRQTIEIRLVDVQECPLADLAIAQLIARSIQKLIARVPADPDTALSSARLHGILQQTIQDAQDARIDDADYLCLLGLPDTPCSAGAVWQHLLSTAGGFDPEQEQAAENILRFGTLASRMRNRVSESAEGGTPALYRTLADCLALGRMLLP
ncbi:glutamate-cysteine ligase family protein [Pontiella sp.]|uniref:carboxylate-amine ligase n=1 Tax=Pontiella sp. TaxID=2837462 RepID=UPI003562AF81